MTYEAALQKAAAYCSRSEHCRYEVQEKLVSWKVDELHHEKILNYLEKEKYIDHKRYALAFVNDKFRYNKWGKIRLSIELQRRRLDDEVVCTALSAIDEVDYQKTANELIINKMRGITYKDHYERDGKLYRFLAGRGFESDIIRNALQQLQNS
jgi:regulatory protein